MPKRKNFNRRALSCTSTRTHLEGRRSVELRNLPFKPCPRKTRAGVSGALWRLPTGTDVVPHIYFCFQMCNRLHELMKNGYAGIFPVYYNLNVWASSLPARPGIRLNTSSALALYQDRMHIYLKGRWIAAYCRHPIKLGLSIVHFLCICTPSRKAGGTP